MSAWDPEYFVRLRRRATAATRRTGIFFRDIVALGAARARARLATHAASPHDLGRRNTSRGSRDEFGITGISNIYGMTETCGKLTMWFPDDPLEKRITGNGRPQPGNECASPIPSPATVQPRGRQPARSR